VKRLQFSVLPETTITTAQLRSVEFYFVGSSVGESVWTLVRQVRRPHLKHVRVMEQPIE
jgi:hypothetical protein